MSKVQVSTHPLVQHWLSQLRDKTTPSPVFRRLVHDMTQVLFVEASTDLMLDDVRIATPLTTCAARRLKETIGLIPILRAGLGMAQAVLDFIPEAQVWHLGVYRDHETHQPVTYYDKFIHGSKLDRAILVDPMLATGGSAIAAIQILKERGVRRVAFLGLIASNDGVKAMQSAHPDVPLFLAAVDPELNANKYIVPGLGDAGDRQFGTC